MIVRMQKLRLLGPRELMHPCLELLQDLELVHLTASRGAGLTAVRPGQRDERRRRDLTRVLSDIEHLLGPASALRFRPGNSRPTSTRDLARWALSAHRTRRRYDRLLTERDALTEERALNDRYLDFYRAFLPVLAKPRLVPGTQSTFVVLRREATDAEARLRTALSRELGEGFELFGQSLPSGERALLLVVAPQVVDKTASLLAAAGVEELPAPHPGGLGLADAVPSLRERRLQIDARLTALDQELRALQRRAKSELEPARGSLRDQLLQWTALEEVGTTSHGFVIEGWTPEQATPRIEAAVAAKLGPTVVLERVEAERWTGDAPVVLRNPRLFRPFELLTRMVPLPRYGTIDPTPFVGVFFPMFFGVILGDIGYGALLGLIAIVILRKTKPASTRRAIGEIAAACALFSVIFGVAYGEFLGSLGRLTFGLHAVAFDREEAIVPFLLVSIGLGLVHILLGLVLAVLGAWRQGHKRAAFGRGATFLMLILVVVALLATFEILPRGFVTPTVAALLVTFVALIVLEGLIGLIELMSAFAHILSYARIMALGTASVMLAVVANRMVGAMGSMVVGVLFALLFHLVNFAIGLFGPTLHALRLHYVEFFGTFYSPGGQPYRPFAHWRPEAHLAA